VKSAKKVEHVLLTGINEQIPQGGGTATNISNFTVDPKTGGWDSRIGYEKFQTADALYGPFDPDGETFSNYVWSTQHGAVQHYMYERVKVVGGVDSGLNQLCSVFGNPAVQTNSRIWVDSLVRRGTDDAGLQYVPYGRFLVILNGHNRPVRLDPRTGYAHPLGWIHRPAPPTPWGVDGDDTRPGGFQGAPIVDYPNNPNGKMEISGAVEGLGYAINDRTNAFRWRVSFISDSGSESPMSEATEALVWATNESNVVVVPPNTPDWLEGEVYPALGPGDFSNKRHAVYLGDFPRGPEGTVARRVYRTKNLGEFHTTDANANPGIIGEIEEYFYVGQVNNNEETAYVDYLPDLALTRLAPLETDSIELPVPAASFGAAYFGRLWLDGGPADPYRVYYSNPNAPDSFGATSFFDFGTSEGGAITNLLVYNNQLLVFRERAIDIIRPSARGFIQVPFVQGIGTKATNTITVVPNAGVIFLSNDGVWLLRGTNDGGGTLETHKLSKNILGTIERLTPSVIAKAVAAYSHTWDEWHCYFPADGAEKPNLGIVLHFKKDGWSIREGFPISSIATDERGNIVFGEKDGRPAGWSNGDDYEAGLFVVSRRRAMGHVVNYDGEVNTTGLSPAPTSTYKTAWMDFGYPSQKKFVKYVYLYVLTEGDNTIGLTHFKDYSLTGTAATGRKMQRAEYVDQAVYDTAAWDTAIWEENMLTEIRYPISQKDSSRFAFEIKTDADIILIGYSVEFAVNETITARGKK
jgi:hypothetical protein